MDKHSDALNVDFILFVFITQEFLPQLEDTGGTKGEDLHFMLPDWILDFLCSNMHTTK